MRAVAAIPAVGLLAGSAFGFFVPEFPDLVGCAALAACASVAVWAWCTSRALVLALAVGTVFSTGGALLSASAWREAWRPALRVAFEALARAERADAAFRWRPVSLDDTALVTVTGVLRADASPRPHSVSPSLDVFSALPDGGIAALSESRSLDGEEIRVEGGVLLTVLGILSTGRINDWRAGRTIRAPARLRRPARYLNPGVPDEERALARRGITLVGSVKSGALVEVVAHGHRLSEAAAEARAFVRSEIASAVGSWSQRSAAITTAIVIGDRAGLDDDVERATAPLFAGWPIRTVKVPHHGSRTSSSWEFLRALAPRIAVVSAGGGNIFGHPAPDVLGRYRRIGAEIFRTDRDGAVMLSTDGRSVDLSTFTWRKLSLR